MAVPTTEALAVDVKYMNKKIDGIEKKQDTTHELLKDFIATAKGEYATKNDVNELKVRSDIKYAKKWVQDVLKWLGIAIGSGAVALFGRALVFYLKNGNG